VNVELDELVEHWTLLDGERELVAGKRGATRLGFALLLKLHTRHGRFLSGPDELPEEAVEFVAHQVDVAVDELAGHEWSGRHRAQIREHLGFRECTVEDATGLQGWLAEHVARADPRMEVVRDKLHGRCRKWRIEPPADGRIERIVRAAVHGAAACARSSPATPPPQALPARSARTVYATSFSPGSRPRESTTR
jgi:hypothetical protein